MAQRSWRSAGRNIVILRILSMLWMAFTWSWLSYHLKTWTRYSYGVNGFLRVANRIKSIVKYFFNIEERNIRGPNTYYKGDWVMSLCFSTVYVQVEWQYCNMILPPNNCKRLSSTVLSYTVLIWSQNIQKQFVSFSCLDFSLIIWSVFYISNIHQ